MKAIWNILHKTFVQEFYKRNAGFFFPILLFAFGIMKPENHIALIGFIFQSWFSTGLVFLVWVLYLLKTIFFVRQRFLWANHHILYQLVLINKPLRWFLLVAMQFMLWLPVLAYSAFMCYYGLLFGQNNATFATASFVLLLPLITIFVYEYRLFRPFPDAGLSVVGQLIHRGFAKPYWSHFIFYLFQKAPLLLFSTKAFTCIIVMGLCKLYPTDTYDERLLSLGALTVGFSHVVMLTNLHEFEHLQFPLLRNLPLSIYQKLRHYTLLFALLLLPELLVLVRYLPVDVSYFYVLCWLVIVLGIQWLGFGRLMQHYNPDTLLRQGFYAFILLFFLVMFHTPPLLLGVAILGTGLWLFQRFYAQSEFIIKG